MRVAATGVEAAMAVIGVEFTMSAAMGVRLSIGEARAGTGEAGGAPGVDAAVGVAVIVGVEVAVGVAVAVGVDVAAGLFAGVFEAGGAPCAVWPKAGVGVRGAEPCRALGSPSARVGPDPKAITLCAAGASGLRAEEICGRAAGGVL